MLEGTRFAPPGQGRPFHILAIRGPAGSGKTHLACSGPGGIAIQSWDFGTRGVVEKHMTEGKQILVAEYQVDVDLQVDRRFKEADSKAEKELVYTLADRQADRIRKEVWLPFVDDRLAACRDPEVRTLVDDTASEMNEVLRLANFGKIEKNPRIAYGPVNAEYKSLVRMAHTYEKNLVLIEQVKRKWKSYTDGQGVTKEVETDELEPKGNASADYLVHSFVDTSFVQAKRDKSGEVVEPEKFLVKISKARLNPQANGMVLENPDWVMLMMFLAPDVPSEAWA